MAILQSIKGRLCILLYSTNMFSSIEKDNRDLFLVKQYVYIYIG